MQLFNVGILELLFILLIAFIVLGPKKAVKAADEMGRWVRKFTKSQFWKDLGAASREIQDLPNKFLEEAELQEMIEQLEQTGENVNLSIGHAQTMLENELSATEGEIRINNHIYPETHQDSQDQQE